MAATQLSIADLGTPLHEVTFVVVDLETTGGSPRDSRVTEIGAVKSRGGEVLGELATLVDPGQPIPAGIQALTGITPGMVAGRPPLEAVLPAFLELSRGCVLVAHNAGFDLGFLQAAAARLAYPRLNHPVLCTAALARRLVRDEVRNCKLETLARRFGTTTTPNHRALSDARATLEVLWGLLERVGSFGVVTLEDLLDFSKARNAPLFASRRHLADGLPSAPGTYRFTSASGEVLYVGTATDLRARVRQYVGATDTRRKIADILKETDHVAHEVCPTPLEAEVRELRAIVAHRPRFNRRSKTPEKAVWLKLTDEVFPRLSVVRAVRDDGGTYLGPLGARRVAEAVADAIVDVIPLRRCTDRITPSTRFPACVLAEMGRCGAPCTGAVDPTGYRPVAEAARRILAGDADDVLGQLAERMRDLGRQGRFEEAAVVRERIRTLITELRRARILTALARSGLIVASAPGGAADTWEVLIARDGLLVATAQSSRSRLSNCVADLVARHALLPSPPSAQPAAEAAERMLVHRWLARAAVRPHVVEGEWTDGVAGGAAIEYWHERLRAAGRRTGRPHAELSSKRRRRDRAAAS